MALPRATVLRPIPGGLLVSLGDSHSVPGSITLFDLYSKPTPHHEAADVSPLHVHTQTAAPRARTGSPQAHTWTRALRVRTGSPLHAHTEPGPESWCSQQEQACLTDEETHTGSPVTAPNNGRAPGQSGRCGDERGALIRWGSGASFWGVFGHSLGRQPSASPGSLLTIQIPRPGPGAA